MSGTLLTPDLRRILDDLARRLGILERRITSRVATPKTPLEAGHSHDGTGDDSTVVHPTNDDGAAASGYHAITVGWGAVAEGSESICLGNAAAYDGQDIAIGQSAEASEGDCVAIGTAAEAHGPDATAIGSNANANFSLSTAVGTLAHTTAEQQIMLGFAGYECRTVQGCPDGAIPSADLGESQMSFYLNEAGNLLVVKAKYSDGTVKTGTVALT